MARVRANVTVFVDNTLRNEGDVFEYNGPADPNLTALDVEAPKAGRRTTRKDLDASADTATD